MGHTYLSVTELGRSTAIPEIYSTAPVSSKNLPKSKDFAMLKALQGSHNRVVNMRHTTLEDVLYEGLLKNRIHLLNI